MTKSGRHKGVFQQKAGVPLLVALFGVTMLAGGTADAASLGHSRVVSKANQPLKIDVPLLQLDLANVDTLQVSLAAQPAWKQAGLTPPVKLSSMHVRVLYGATSQSRLIQITSDQAFNKSVADLLINVRTATGNQVYQVSILTRMQGANSPLSVVESSGNQASGTGQQAPAGKRIEVMKGDTMFAIARRNAVAGVSVYQMMIGLQRANQQAFIRNNLNLVRAGAVLTMPDKAALTAISDAEARRLFVQQVQAFEQYRQRLAGAAVAPVTGQLASQGKVTKQSSGTVTPKAGTTRDEVVLSGGNGADNASDQRTSTQLAAADSSQRITQLEHNVKKLQQAVDGNSADGNGTDSSSDAAGTNASGAAAASTGQAGTSNSPSGSSSSSVQKSGASGSSGKSSGSVSGSSSPTGQQGASGSSGHELAASESGSDGAASGASAAVSGAATGNTTGAGATTGAAAASADQSDTSATHSGTAQKGSGSMAAATTTSASGTSSTTASSPSGTSANSSGNSSGNSSTAASAGSDGHTASNQSGTTSTGPTATGTSTSGNAPSTVGSVSPDDNASSVAEASSDGGTTSTDGAPSASGTSSTGGDATSGTGGTMSADASGASPSTHGNGQSNTTAGAQPDNVATAAQTNSQDKAGKNVSWFEEHLLASITAGLVLIVLIIAWLLRRMNTTRDKDGDGRRAQITEAMVQEKLDQINLDLRDTPADTPPSTKN